MSQLWDNLISSVFTKTARLIFVGKNMSITGVTQELFIYFKK